MINQLSKEYGYKFYDLHLLRDWIGQVYLVTSDSKKYILKIFREQHSSAAKQSALVMNYLYERDFTVPAIMKTLSGESFFLTAADNHVAILYEYLDGSEPERNLNLQEIGKLAGQMRKLMEQYPGNLSRKDDQFYIERYLSILSKMEYADTEKFHEYGVSLWNRVRDNFTGFCHGDFHTGNMLMKKNKLYLFDFDACGIGYPLYDIATLCDETDYFSLSDTNFENGIIKLKENVAEFLLGCSQYDNLNKMEIRALYDYIALRHYDIQATIIDCRGLNCVDHAFLDNQYRWLVKWEDACAKL